MESFEKEVEKEENEKETSKIELEEKISSLQDSLLRKVAEFENYKRRTENDQMNLIKYGAESFILKILPVYDDLQRSLLHLDTDKIESVKEGLKLVLDKFTKTLTEQGIKKIDAKGQEFDVEYHEALLQQPSNEFPPHTVIEEVDPGYIYKDKVIKHAKVIVSKEVESIENQESKTESEE
ncbi:MAG: nucleotide exchange factor GrpE [Ignavibacteriales bacterium]|nr:nucleotide exchange factor GrpE [Ignavibacteriales bacterium]